MYSSAHPLVMKVKTVVSAITMVVIPGVTVILRRIILDRLLNLDFVILVLHFEVLRNGLLLLFCLLRI
jgi:hypothetical protein